MKKQIQTLAALIAGVTIITPLSVCSCGKSEETTTSATTAATTTTTTEATTASESTEATTEETKAMAEVTENPLIDPKNPLALDPYTGIQDMDPSNVGKRSIVYFY